MKKIAVWMIVIAVLGGVVLLVQMEIVEWQTLAIAVAAFAGPARLLAGLLGDEDALTAIPVQRVAQLETEIANLRDRLNTGSGGK